MTKLLREMFRQWEGKEVEGESSEKEEKNRVRETWKDLLEGKRNTTEWVSQKQKKEKLSRNDAKFDKK